ncbi:aldo/keto reductase [Arthrobacter sp. AK01]|uniref:aldo/keto reductase n=1 Tax=Arthrobacter sp. AK01 TaxID=2894084 RepID=UPI001E36DCCF|nr:aldo/keto reductase [Arthrobacter sp. AK01]MCD4849688.1 aldo/keto reductase [Arthrobacter sp. AK01]
MTGRKHGHIGLGLAAIGRPAYITAGRDNDLGDSAERTPAHLRNRAHQLLDAAWDAGVRYFDAARSYGYAEEFLGSWLAGYPGRRPDLVIGSKWGYEYVGNWTMDADVHERKEHSPAMFERQWPQTVQALGTPPDLYLIHSVTPDSPALSDTRLLEQLRQLSHAGVRVGISTSGPAQGEVIDRARSLPGSPFQVVQATWNVLEQSAAPALARAHEAGWFVVVKEALANGRLTDGGPVESVNDLACWDGQTTDAFALGAALAQPWADVVLSGAVTPAQLSANLAARTPTDDRELAPLAVDPNRYWSERAVQAWQ